MLLIYRQAIFILFFFFFCLFQSTVLLAAENETVNFLTLADIHFDPFIACYNKPAPCALIQKLRQAPASQWAHILATDDKSIQQYRLDTSYHLLTSTLAAAKVKSQAMNVQFVLVMGDFLAHDNRNFYIQFTGDRSRAGYAAFVKKTMEFLRNELAAAFPSTDVYVVVGNNDSYRYDYMVEPNSAFFRDMGQIFSSLIKNKHNRQSMLLSFPIAGYYAVDLTNLHHMRLIGLNSVLFSDKARGNHIEQAAKKELDWLHQQLAAAKVRHQKVFIAMHIPAGVDIYGSLKYRLLRLIELWKPIYIQRFEEELQAFAPQMAAIFSGHLHIDWLQMLTLNNANSIPIAGTPSVSPIFGNNPGFKIYTYNVETARLDDYQTFYYSLSDKRAWSAKEDKDRFYQSDCQNCRLLTGLHLMEYLDKSMQAIMTYRNSSL